MSVSRRERIEEGIIFETKCPNLSSGDHLPYVLKGNIPIFKSKKLYQVELDRQGRHYLRLLQWGSRASGKVLADLGGGELISVLSRPLCLLIEVRFLPSHRDWEIGTQY